MLGAFVCQTILPILVHLGRLNPNLTKCVQIPLKMLELLGAKNQSWKRSKLRYEKAEKV